MNSHKVAWAWLALWLLVVARAEGAETAAQSEGRLKESVTYLASDALEGRGVGTEGLNKAAEYLAAQFARLGLRTDLFNGTPFQEFEATLSAELGPAEKNRLVFVGSGGDTPAELKLNDDFTPLAVGGSKAFEGPLVFAGYGITARDLKRESETLTYDDYAGLDVKGKVVIILRKEPQQSDEQSPFSGKQTTQHAYFARKLHNAADRGAAAVIFVNDGPELANRREESTKLLKESLHKLAQQGERLDAMKANDASVVVLAKEVRKAAVEAVELSKEIAAKSDSLLPFAGAGDTTTHRELPVFFCSRGAIDRVLEAAGQKNLAAFEAAIDRELKPQSVELRGWRAIGETNVVEKKATVKNVVAVLEGEGPLADETIVVGAHYDHLGRGGAGSLAPWTTDIHNGADDNASGTATLLEIAQRLASAPERPRRRIVFIAFTGEERGLWGSAHYCRQPRFPLEKTVAMFNLDMVGRLADDKLAIYGTGTAQEFDPLVEKLAAEHKFKLTKHAGGYGPSDHNSFYAKKVPVLHFFTGTHTDYHRPSDDTEKLNIAGMRRIADILVDCVKATDANSERPTYVEIRRIESLAGPGDNDRPSFGSMPAYPNPVKDGVLLEAVLEGTPADKAGIKGGDVLVKFGDNKVVVLEDFQNALTQYKPGDKVKVTVRRGEELIEAEVTLARRRAMP
jgi:hypothetical protein